MTENYLHDRENNEWSESFLKENGKKFGDDCVTVLRLLYKGMRLTAKQTNDITGMADGGRRLREIFGHRKECQKAARRINGKFEGVEYWLEIPQPATKTELVKEVAYRKGVANASDHAKEILKTTEEVKKSKRKSYIPTHIQTDFGFPI